MAGHLGKIKTFELLDRNYYWESAAKFVKQFIRNCYLYTRAKPRYNAKYRLLRPLPVP